MEKKITIGIPRAFLYYRYKVLWTNFFQKLNCNVIISPKTTKEMLNEGLKNSVDESCISAKIYLGHVESLRNQCDYILVPRLSDYGQKEKTCIKFNGLYDVIKNTYPDLELLDYNIEKTKHKTELLSFLKLGQKLNKSLTETYQAYKYAKKIEKEHNNKLMEDQNKLLISDKIKILIVSHPYNIYDEYLGEPIIKILQDLDVTILYSDRLKKEIAIKHAEKLSPTLYWTHSKELIGAIDYYQDNIDGIIFISSFPCGPDSLVNELMIRKITDIPMTNILINESTAEAGLQTRLESFIDILKEGDHHE